MPSTGLYLCMGLFSIFLVGADLFPKISLAASPDSGIYPSPSRPTEGRVRIVRDAGRDAVDAAASGAQVNCRAGFGLSQTRERPNGAQTNDAFAYGKTVWSWHPLLVSSRRRFCEPNRVRQNRQFADDGDKTNSSPGRARSKP